MHLPAECCFRPRSWLDVPWFAPRESPTRLGKYTEAGCRLASMVGRLGDWARIRGQRDLLGKPLSLQVFNWNNEGKGHQERSGTVKWQDRISINPQVCHGRPCIKETPVMVSVILANLGEGET